MHVCDVCVHQRVDILMRSITGDLNDSHVSGVIGSVSWWWCGTCVRTLVTLSQWSLQSPWPWRFSLQWCFSSCVCSWCLLNCLTVSLSVWLYFHRNLRFPQSSSSSRRSWICLYNPVSLWISDAGMVPMIFSTVLHLVTLTEMFWRTRTHPSPTLRSFFHALSFNVFVYYKCFLLFHLIAWLPCIPTPTRLPSALIFICLFISTLASLLVTHSPSSFLSDFPFSHDFLSHTSTSRQRWDSHKNSEEGGGGGAIST